MRISDRALFDLMGRLPLFSGLTAEQFEIIRPGAYFTELDRDEILFHQGDPGFGFFFVLRGQMQLTVSTAEGTQKVVEIVTTSESFGEAVVFDGRQYPVTATALVQTRLLGISSAVVLYLLDHDPSFGRRMLSNMAVRLRRLIRDVESYSLQTSIQRVIGFLLYEARPDAETGQAERTVTLPTRKQVLASRLNIAPETLSRVLRDLSAASLISVEGRQITLHDVEALESRLDLTVRSATLYPLSAAS